jgi:hypothetical protein
MILRPLTSFALAVAVVLASSTLIAQNAPAPASVTNPPALIGRIEHNTYISPTKMFRIQIPVLAELGGTTTDAGNGVVTFQDTVGVHISVACFWMDATQRWNEETRGRRDYLTRFFADIVQGDFADRFPGSSIESAKFRPSLMDGSVFAFILLPGGSMFGDRTIARENEPPAVAKRGNLLFIKDEHVYVISIELTEKVLERNSWKKTPAEEDEILESRLLDVLAKMSFTKVPPRDNPTSSSDLSPTPTLAPTK